MLSMPAETRLPVSEFESPKLKTAGGLKWMDLERGKEMEINVRIWITQVLAAMENATGSSLTS